jgi:hypothetical protein
MRRPNWRPATFAAVSGVVGIAILAGCTTRQYGLSATGETAHYLHSARGRYAIPGPPQDPWGPYIREASARFDIPETWIRALMRQESGGNLYRNGELITSGAGAMGLMQVMPGTYEELRYRHNLGPDPFEPHDNIMAGVGYMREMYDIYGAPGFLAAYNAGPNRLDDYLSNQRGLPDETRRYVASIGPSLRTAQPRVHSPAEQYAMNQLPLYIPPGPRFTSGSGPVPTFQLASASSGYTPAAFVQTQVPPVYAAAPQPRAVAWPDSPRLAASPTPPPVPPVYAAAPQPRAVAWPDSPRLAASPTPPPAPSVYAAAPQPHAVAWPESPKFAAIPTPPPAPQPPALAWNSPPKPGYAPPRTLAFALPPPPPPPQRTEVARAEAVDDDENSPARRSHGWNQGHEPVHQVGSTRLALDMPRLPPVQRSGGGFHLISGAVAAEAYPVRHGRRYLAAPVSYGKSSPTPAERPKGSSWTLRASGPIQAPPACRKDSHGKTVC